MPRKRREAKRRLRKINPFMVALLSDGELPDRGAEDGDWWEAFDASFPGHRAEYPNLRPEWDRVRDRLLTEWIGAHPGTRPWGWWLFDAPRWQPPYPQRLVSLAWHCQLLAEPRRRIGGIGTPAFEVLGYWPEYRLGIPVDWVDDFAVQYHNGRAVDVVTTGSHLPARVHGVRIGTAYHDGDFAGLAPRAADPPTVESQATYLDRHGLLPQAERRVLTAIDFEPERLGSSGRNKAVATGAARARF